MAKNSLIAGRFWLLAVLAALSAWLPHNAVAEAVHYVILPGSEVVFESKAPLETFHGRTDQVSGWFEVDMSDPVGPVDLQVAVNLATFDTGNRKRNGHMRENHLETDAFPQAWFRGGEVTGEVLGAEFRTLTVAGEMDLHGVRRNLTCDITIRHDADGTMRLTTEFIIRLSDYEIERPRFLVMKLADEQKVRIQLKAGAGKDRVPR